MTIPSSLLKALDLRIGDQVTLSVERGKLIAQPFTRKRYSLTELLRGSAKLRRLTAKVAWATDGDPVGREII